MNIMPPDLSFACELEAQPLKALIANLEVIEFLQATKATISLGILDLSQQRAEVVRCLNDAGVPVTAWLLLPREQGYWFNLDNYHQAVLRYEQFKAWSKEYNLSWARIGLDIEPDLRAMQLLATNRMTGSQRLIRQAIDTPRLQRGSQAYQSLVEQIHRDGYAVETYQMPFIVDERLAGSKLIQRLTGIVNLSGVEREVLMLYSSFLRPWGQGVLWSYAPQARGIGVGITGRGMEQETAQDVRPLNWAELETDLLLARRNSENIFIFSLEGCVEQGFLPLLRNFDWQKPVQIPYAAAQRVENLRSMIRRALWLMGRPAWVLFGMAMLASALTLIVRRRR